MNRLQILEDMFEHLHIIGKHLGPGKFGTNHSICPVSKPQLRILYVIYNHEKITVNELAASMEITAGAITQLVETLVTQNILKKEKDINDKRSVLLSFTDKGKDTFLSMKKEHLTALLPIFDALSDEELQTMIKLQKKIIANILPKTNNV